MTVQTLADLKGGDAKVAEAAFEWLWMSDVDEKLRPDIAAVR